MYFCQSAKENSVLVSKPRDAITSAVITVSVLIPALHTTEAHCDAVKPNCGVACLNFISNEISVNKEVPSNASLAIDATLSGIIIFVIVEPEKARLPISFKLDLSAKDTLVSAPSNTPSPIFSTLAGIIISVDIADLNAQFPIVFN
jgi:hypothetical protein